MAQKKTGAKRTVREKEHHSTAPKLHLLRRKKEEMVPNPKKTRKRSKKKTRVQHMFKKGEPHGSRPY